MNPRPQYDGSPPADLPWRAKMAVLTMAHAVGTMQSVSVFAMAPVIRGDMKLSTAQLGLFVSAYYFAQMCCVLAAGVFVDRLGVPRSLAVAHGFLAGGSVCLALAGSLPVALLAMAMMGIGYAMVNPATALGVVDWFPAERRATAMGVKQTGVPIGGVGAAMLAMLAGWLNWRGVMVSIAVLTLAHLGCCLLLPETRMHRAVGHGAGVLSQVGTVFSIHRLRKFALANIFLQIGQGNFFAYLTLFLRDVVLLNQSLAAVGMAVAQAASAIGRVGWGLLCDALFRERRVRLVIILCLLAIIGFGLFLSVAGGDLYLALIACAFLGATIAAFAGLMLTIAAESVEPPRAATAVGFNLTAVYFGGVIGPPLFGLGMDWYGGYPGGWIVTIGSVFVGVLLLLPRWKKDA